jgi:hypothetical protein
LQLHGREAVGFLPLPFADSAERQKAIAMAKMMIARFSDKADGIRASLPDGFVPDIKRELSDRAFIVEPEI